MNVPVTAFKVPGLTSKGVGFDQNRDCILP
jgi:hypothetical protein